VADRIGANNLRTTNDRLQPAVANGTSSKIVANLEFPASTNACKRAKCYSKGYWFESSRGSSRPQDFRGLHPFSGVPKWLAEHVRNKTPPPRHLSVPCARTRARSSGSPRRLSPIRPARRCPGRTSPAACSTFGSPRNSSPSCRPRPADATSRSPRWPGPGCSTASTTNATQADPEHLIGSHISHQNPRRATTPGRRIRSAHSRDVRGLSGAFVAQRCDAWVWWCRCVKLPVRPCFLVATPVGWGRISGVVRCSG
jgi:hypothetical protein